MRKVLLRLGGNEIKRDVFYAPFTCESEQDFQIRRSNQTAPRNDSMKESSVGVDKLVRVSRVRECSACSVCSACSRVFRVFRVCSYIDDSATDSQSPRLR